MKKIRMLAEWERPDSILMAFPHTDTDWNYIIDEAGDQFARLVEAFTNNGIKVYLLCDDIEEVRTHLSKADHENLILIEGIFNDTWTRDYGPVTIENAEGKLLALDFGFNGWGLKFAADKDNLVNLNLQGTVFKSSAYRNNRDFILEGGSLETDGRGTLLTTTRCLCSPNRNGGKNRKELAKILSERLGFSHFLWLDNGYLEGDDTDSHIDTLARFSADGKSIIYTGPGELDDDQAKSLAAMRDELKALRDTEGNPYNLIELPLPQPIYSDGERLPATYANYLITADRIFLPIYSQPENDEKAVEVMKKAFPNHKVIPVECNTLLKQHGSLHCSTMQLYAGIEQA